MAQLFDWRVSYIGFAGPVSCIVTPWGAYGPCSADCAGGVRHRNRTVVQEPSHGGSACPSVVSFTLCHTAPCVVRPTDCRVSAWSVWNATARWVTAGRASLEVANVVAAAPENLQSYFRETHKWPLLNAACGISDQVFF